MSKEDLKKKFFSNYWVEERQEYLISLQEEQAKEIVESFDDYEVHLNVNSRRSQQSYICDYLEYLWHLSPEAFWQHVRVSFLNPEGTLISDNPFHIEILCKEEIPDDVWITILESLFFIEKDGWENLSFEIIRSQTLESKNKQLMQQKLIDWVNNFETKYKDHLLKTYEELDDIYDLSILDLSHINKSYLLDLLKEVYINDFPEWLQ